MKLVSIILLCACPVWANNTTNFTSSTVFSSATVFSRTASGGGGGLDPWLELQYTFPTSGTISTVTDQTTHSHTGTTTGSPSGVTLTGKSTGAIVLTGVENISIANPSTLPKFNKPWTVNLWMNVAATSVGYIFTWGDNAGAHLDLYQNGTLFIGGDIGPQCTGPTLVVNQTYMVTFTYDGSSVLNIYTNGVSGGTQSGITFNSWTGNTAILGSFISGNFFNITGQVGFTQLYSTNKTSAEILTLYGAGPQ